MSWVVIGLGNPGEEYKDTRHNTGRMALEFFAKKNDFGAWKVDKKANARTSGGMVGKTAVALVAPDTFMNKSGTAAARYVKSVKAAERMIVVYDDLDLPLGTLKLSFERGSGGHKGLESIMRALKTKKFARVRIGISPSTASGAIRKPHGEQEVEKFILGRFKSSEMDELKKVFKHASEAMTAIIQEGPQIAMNQFN